MNGPLIAPPKADKSKSMKRNRTIFLMLISVVVFFVFFFRLVQWQVIQYSTYKTETDKFIATPSPVKAARGEILDRYGRKIAINRDGYNIVFDAAYLNDKNINEMLINLTELLTSNNDTWRDRLPISAKEPFSFDTSGNMSDATMKKKLDLGNWASAVECTNHLISKYNLEEYETEQKRTLMGIRFTMFFEDYSVAHPYTFAEDISQKTRDIILEQAFSFGGVTIVNVPVREYTSTDIAPHLIGFVGPIYAETWDKYKDLGYGYDDYVGINGVEKAFENILRGTNGTRKVMKNTDGSTVIEIITEETAGNTVLLSIDKRVQKEAQKSIKNAIFRLQSNGVYAKSGSVVVINCNNGEIIASANYPTFDMKDYKDNYSTLAKNPDKPLFDRAFNGTYPPGSTFKPGVLFTGLENGNVTKDEGIYCTSEYKFEDRIMTCLSHHYNTDAIKSIRESCNFYYYELGQRIGITKMNEYSRKFGFGQKTGVEVPEANGVLAGPDYAKQIKTSWYIGDNSQAAIGQSYNLATPLQLATYTATIANGGTRYNAHLLHEIRSYNLEEQVSAPQSIVLDRLNDTPTAENDINTVKQGMLSAAGAQKQSAQAFKDLPFKIGIKTGTSETHIQNVNNSVYIAFAPYENPEIAISVVIERGQWGYECYSVVADVLKAYFNSDNEPYINVQNGVLLP